jgi:WD40 repeat protein
MSFQGNNLSVAVHEKSGIFAAGDSFGAIHIWETDEVARHKFFRKKQIIKGHISNVWALLFDKNTNSLITASDDHKIKIWNKLCQTIQKNEQQLNILYRLSYFE